MIEEQDLLWEEKRKEEDDYYLVSRFSACFHRPGCIWVKKIKAVNKVPYASRKDIKERRACKYCGRGERDGFIRTGDL